MTLLAFLRTTHPDLTLQPYQVAFIEAIERGDRITLWAEPSRRQGRALLRQLEEEFRAFCASLPSETPPYDPRHASPQAPSCEGGPPTRQGGCS